jgi:hypothetical protein
VGKTPFHLKKKPYREGKMMQGSFKIQFAEIGKLGSINFFRIIFEKTHLKA